MPVYVAEPRYDYVSVERHVNFSLPNDQVHARRGSMRVVCYKDVNNGGSASKVVDRPVQDNSSESPSTSGREVRESTMLCICAASGPRKTRLRCTSNTWLNPSAMQEESFVWTKHWYPLAAVEDLNPQKPFATKLLGEPTTRIRPSQAGTQFRVLFCSE